MRSVGLLLTKDNLTTLKYTLERNAEFFERIYVIEGSEDHAQARDILKSFKQVVSITADKDLGILPNPVDGSIRQPILQHISAEEGPDKWITLLHGDEELLDNPNEVIPYAEIGNKWAIEWHRIDFVWHISQAGMKQFDNPRWLRWYWLPAAPKIRQFRLRPGIFYRPMIDKDLPSGGAQLEPFILTTNAIVKHYPLCDTFFNLQKRYKESLAGRRLKSFTYTWILKAFTEEELLFSDIPYIPGCIPKNARMFDVNEQPLMRTL